MKILYLSYRGWGVSGVAGRMLAWQWHIVMLFFFFSLHVTVMPTFFQTLQALNTLQQQQDKHSVFIYHPLTFVLSFWRKAYPPKFARVLYCHIGVSVQLLTVRVFGPRVRTPALILVSDFGSSIKSTFSERMNFELFGPQPCWFALCQWRPEKGWLVT